MFRKNKVVSRVFTAALFLAIGLFAVMSTVSAQSSEGYPSFSPVVNGEALKGMSTINSAESMGEGRITFGVLVPWYKQRIGYSNAPNLGADVFTGTGAFSYGVNSYVDIFGSISGFGISDYTRSKENSGLGTIRAGAQGSLPFPNKAFLRMGGQAALIGGTSHNQINTYRADGYNYFETRTGFDIMGKLMQTALSGNEAVGIKFHLNEAGVISLDGSEPALLLLGAGFQANMGYVVFGTEINSRTRFSDLSINTDPLWITPSITLRTPYQMNVTAGVDVSLSSDRSGTTVQPRALEPYRVFGALAFSLDLLANKRKAEAAQKIRAAHEKDSLEQAAAQTAAQTSEHIQSLTEKATGDSIELANERLNSRQQMDEMQKKADLDAQANQTAVDALAKKATADSLALIAARKSLEDEKSKRSDAEKLLLSTGELLLDAVYFETGKTIITINSKSYLNVIGKMLTKYPKLQFEVAGHTDNIGANDFNVTLSQGRADAVRIYLTETEPALGSNLSARGYGMSAPKADNNTKDGRQINRRVELRVTNKDALQEYN